MQDESVEKVEYLTF
jgi:hypothetical protein